MAKKVKKKEQGFDFDKAYKEFSKLADSGGLKDDLSFQTVFKEFKRMKLVCDEMYTKIEEVGVSYQEEGSKGQITYKTNPLNKEYISAHKALVGTCETLKRMSENVNKVEDNWL